MKKLDVNTMSGDELIDSLKEKNNKMLLEIEKTKAETAKSIARTEQLKEETARIKAENDQMLKRRGWWGITDDELKWLMDGNYEKIAQYFEPALETIKMKYAEAMGIDLVESTKFKEYPDFEIPNAWINRLGKYFPVRGFAEHNSWAITYLKSINKPHKEDGKEAYEILEAYGWVRIMKWPGLPAKFILPKDLSHAQKKTIDIYCTLYEWPLPFDDYLFNKK